MNALASLMRMMGRPSVQKLVSYTLRTVKKVDDRLNIDSLLAEFSEKGITICTVPIQDDGKQATALILVWKQSDFENVALQRHREALRQQGFRIIVGVLDKDS